MGLLFDELSSLCQQLELMHKELASKKDVIRGQMKSRKKLKKVLQVTCTAAFISLLVLSVALAAIAVPPVATGAAVMGSTMIKTGEQWLDMLWTERLVELEGERDVVGVMWKEGVVRVHEMENIRALITGLEMGFGSVLYYARFAMERVSDKVGMAMAMEGVMGKVGMVKERLNELELKVVDCDVEIRKTIVEFLKVIEDDAV